MKLSFIRSWNLIIKEDSMGIIFLDIIIGGEPDYSVEICLPPNVFYIASV